MMTSLAMLRENEPALSQVQIDKLQFAKVVRTALKFCNVLQYGF
jgi:hypothetical protein